MNWDQIEGAWKQFVGRARERWADLSDDEIERIKGKRDQLVGAIQKKRGVARQEAEREVEDWARSL